MTSFEKKLIVESSRESMFLRTLKHIDFGVSMILRNYGVEDLFNTPVDEFVRNTYASEKEDAAKLSDTERAVLESKITAQHSIELLQQSIRGYFYAAATGIKNRKLREQQARHGKNFKEAEFAQALEEATLAATQNLCDTTYTQFHHDMIQMAAKHGITHDAELYFTWRIEKSGLPIVFTMDTSDSGPRLTAPDFYTDSALQEFHAWNREMSM